MIRRLIFVLGLALMAAACIKEDSTATWYLEPSGHVVWSILERDVRSDAEARDARDNEEDQFLIAAKVRDHAVGRGLIHLGATGVKTTVIHGKAPFIILTEGEFSGLDVLGRRFLSAYRIGGTSFVSHDRDSLTWTLTIDELPSDDTSTEQDAAEVTALLGDRLQVALREGVFTKAEGFTISPDGRIATMQGGFLEVTRGENLLHTLKLTWEERR